MDSVRLSRSVSVSVLIHLTLLFAWLFVGHQYAPKSKKPEWIQIEIAQPQKQRKVQDLANDRRVVQTDAALPTKEVAPDAMLGERTQTVDRQTVSREQKTQMAKTAQSPNEKTKGAEKPKLSQLGLPILDPNKIRGAQEGEWRASDVFSPQDYIRGINESDKTVLNTKEYAFYGYFQRIRERLDMAWTSSLRSQLAKFYKGGRQLAGEMDHTTKVLVTLNGGGEIVRVQVLEESGTRDLDDAAVHAFNQAGPFPNPPNGIVDPGGLIQIRWDFILKT